MKKLLAIAMALVLAASMVACGSDEKDTSASDTTVSDTTVSDTTTAGDDTTTAETVIPELEGMTYEQFVAAADQAEIKIVTYVQNKQSWWDNKATIYTQNADGGYFLYEMQCTEEDYNKLVPGTKIEVTGYKAAFHGELELIDATYSIVEGETYVASAKDVTSLLGTADLEKDMNKFVAFKGMTIEASKNDSDEDVACVFKAEGDDIYFKASVNGKTYDFCIEKYLTGPDTDVYKAVSALKIGDTVNMEGFLYWYDGANPHITSVSVVNGTDSSTETEGEVTQPAESESQNGNETVAPTVSFCKPGEIIDTVIADDKVSVTITAGENVLKVEKSGDIACMTMGGVSNYVDLKSGKLYAPTQDGKWIHTDEEITYDFETFLSTKANIDSSMYYFNSSYYEDFDDDDTVLTFKTLTLSVLSTATGCTFERSASAYTVTETYPDGTVVKVAFDLSAEPQLTLPVVS